MPTTEQTTSIQNYPMSIGGVNIAKNIVELNPKECVSMQNVVYKNGIRKRKGNRKSNANQVVASKKILGVHRFYYGTSKQLLAACDTKVVYENGGVWADAVTGLTSDSGWRAITSFATSVFDAGATAPLDISVASDGTLWVCDAQTDKIYHITNTGTLISSFATSVFDANATAPSGITIASDGTLWVCDLNADKIYHITNTGTLISSFATSVFDASALTIDGIAIASDGTLWVGDQNTDKIYHITNTGTLISSFATSVFDASATNSSLAVATDGTLWVCDYNTDKIYHITNTGTLISSFATSVFDASATLPRGIAIASDGTLWVVDSNTDKIYHLELVNNSTTFTTWGALSKCYIANGVDAPRSWTGSAAATVTAAPSLTKQFLPYQDRLLSIDNNNRGQLTWSASFSDSAAWETAANCGVKPDTDIHGMIIHSYNNNTAGPQSSVLLAGASDMHVFRGSNLTVPFTTGDYRVFPLGLRVGCSAVRTMAWTPVGTMWLGNDRQVYLLPFDSSQAVPISQKIYSFNNNFQGLEKIPSNQLQNACAIYHEGYYKLSFAGADSTLNNFQFWLDVNNFYKDDLGQYGPWYGKMTGQTIGCYATQSGTGDGGELVMGEQNETTGGYVYIQDNNQVYGDQADSLGNSGTAIDISYQTFYNPLGDPNYKKVIPHIEVEALTSSTNITAAFNDIDASAGSSTTFTISGTTGSPARKVLHMSPQLNTRRLSLTFTHSSSSADFQLYSINAKTKEMFLPFA